MWIPTPSRNSAMMVATLTALVLSMGLMTGANAGYMAESPDEAMAVGNEIDRASAQTLAQLHRTQATSDEPVVSATYPTVIDTMRLLMDTTATVAELTALIVYRHSWIPMPVVQAAVFTPLAAVMGYAIHRIRVLHAGRVPV